MLVPFKDLKGVPVETRSGETLGKLADVTLETDGHAVARYHVARARTLSKLLPSELLVHAEQVISVTTEKIVVRDSAVEEMAGEAAVAAAERAASATPAGVSGRVLTKQG